MEEKLTLDDTFINNQVAAGIKTISVLLGDINAITNSKNFESLTQLQQNQIHHTAYLLECALGGLNYSIEYFTIQEDENGGADGQ